VIATRQRAAGWRDLVAAKELRERRFVANASLASEVLARVHPRRTHAMRSRRPPARQSSSRDTRWNGIERTDAVPRNHTDIAAAKRQFQQVARHLVARTNDCVRAERVPATALPCLLESLTILVSELLRHALAIFRRSHTRDQGLQRMRDLLVFCTPAREPRTVGLWFSLEFVRET